MNTIPPLAAQAENFATSQVFPQPMPSVVMTMPPPAARRATLTFLDAGAIDIDTAENWLSTIETIKS